MKPTPLKVIAQFVGQKHPSNVLITGGAIDSRLVTPGDLFFALPGERVDGHTFLEQAAEKGAAAAVVSETYRGEAFGLPLLPVPDVLHALQLCAKKILERRSSKVIAITGSIGKTTTKGFLTKFLRSQYTVFASPLSYNTQSTVPVTILNARGDEEYLVLEMGISEPGNLERLVSIAPPDIALLLSVAVQHAIDFKDGLAGIAREKATIFSQEKTRLGIVHHDLLHFDDAIAVGSCEKQTFSLLTKQADFSLMVGEEEIAIYDKKEERAYPISFNLPMKEHLHNLLAAVSAARAAGVAWESICTIAPTLTLPPMRFEKVKKGEITFINDAYNANPDSMLAALSNLPTPLPGGKRVAVLGDMDALGQYSEEGHQRVALAASEQVDLFFCLGARWPEEGPAERFAEREEVVARLKESVSAGDVVLLKGARSHALEKILDFF